MVLALSLIPALRRQVDLCEFKSGLQSSRTAKATQSNPLLKKEKGKQTNKPKNHGLGKLTAKSLGSLQNNNNPILWGGPILKLSV